MTTPRGKPRRSGASYKLRQIYDRKRREHLNTYGVIVCHLCGGAIDLDLPSRHDDSLSWDHIIPVAVAPHLEESADNLAPAHFACNRTRQDRDLDEIVGTPQRVEAFKALVTANKERNEARKKLSAANRDKLRTPAQRAANLFDAPATVSSRHWCGPVIDRNGVRHDGACTPGCPHDGHPGVYDYRLEPEVTR